MKCIGYGEHEGKCNNEAGSTHSEYWCQRCDDIRRKTITDNLKNILADKTDKCDHQYRYTNYKWKSATHRKCIFCGETIE